MISYQAATESWHLKAILEIQQANLPKNISDEEAIEQGFVTVEHELNLLTEMNASYGHQVALHEEQLAGYALMMLSDFKTRIPVLFPLFERLDKLEWEGELLSNVSYFVIGQVCVAKDYRGKGVSKKLYDTMAHRLSGDFRLMVTEVSDKNMPSLKAHEKAGFKDILSYEDEGGRGWVVVARDLKNT